MEKNPEWTMSTWCIQLWMRWNPGFWGNTPSGSGDFLELLLRTTMHGYDDGRDDTCPSLAERSWRSTCSRGHKVVGKNPWWAFSWPRAFLQSHTMPETEYILCDTQCRKGKSLIIVVAYNNLFGKAKMIGEYFKETGCYHYALNKSVDWQNF